MPYFTPPVVRRPAESTRGDRLFGRLNIPVGLTVLKSATGGYETVEDYTDEQIDAAAIAYIGGHVYPVSADEAAALTAAGYEVTP